DFSLDFEELDDDLPLDLDDELIVAAEPDDGIEDIEFSLDLDEPSDVESTGGSSKLDGELEVDALDDMGFDLDLDLDDELDDSLALEDTVAKSEVGDKGLNKNLEYDFSLDLDDDLDPSSNSADISLDDGLGNDFSVQIDEDDDSDVNDFEFDIPADDSEGLSLSLDDDDIDIDSFDLDTELDAETADEINAANSEIDADDSLDLDSPPPTDIDMASLDEEIEAMTAGMDTLSVDEDEVVEATETAETLNLEADKEPELRRDDDKLTSSDLNISDANDDAVVAADEELDFFEESDEVSTKLDLAKAYIDMGDREGAEDILNEVMEEGNDRQKSDAKVLMENL
ncbi:MAG: pilus assembly protein FimV, partial [Cellvibrionaceae bacterium]